MVCGIRCAFSARNISAERLAPRARPRVVPSIRDGRRVRGSFVERGRGVDVMWRGGSITRCCFFLAVLAGGMGRREAAVGGGGLAVVVVMVVSGGGREESVDGEWYVLLSSGIWRKTYFDEKVRVTLFS